jgi:hypothetical protein
LRGDIRGYRRARLDAGRCTPQTYREGRIHASKDKPCGRGDWIYGLRRPRTGPFSNALCR